VVARPSKLFAHGLDDHPLGPPAVEFGVVDLLPGSEIELALGDRNDDLVVHQQALQMGIAIDFARAMVPVILTEGRQLFQPLIYIGN